MQCLLCMSKHSYSPILWEFSSEDRLLEFYFVDSEYNYYNVTCYEVKFSVLREKLAMFIEVKNIEM